MDKLQRFLYQIREKNYFIFCTLNLFSISDIMSQMGYYMYMIYLGYWSQPDKHNKLSQQIRYYNVI